MDQPESTMKSATKAGFIMRLSTTRFNYWAEFCLDFPLGATLIFLGLTSPSTRWGVALFTLTTGLLIITLFEYVVHRWVFHGPPSLFSKGHDAHHQNPMGYDALPFFLPAIVLLGSLGVMVLLMPSNYALLLSGVLSLGYVVYGLSHFAIHHVKFRSRLSVRWAGNHRIHHHHPELNFGVTSPLWDVVMGTKFRAGKKD
jgi:sterol desaturase/sphingolipid hydroxylase (fatty acid hydroxylase superfamily)